MILRCMENIRTASTRSRCEDSIGPKLEHCDRKLEFLSLTFNQMHCKLQDPHCDSKEKRTCNFPKSLEAGCESRR
jgi:hypothetical protein